MPPPLTARQLPVSTAAIPALTCSNTERACTSEPDAGSVHCMWPRTDGDKAWCSGAAQLAAQRSHHITSCHHRPSGKTSVRCWWRPTSTPWCRHKSGRRRMPRTNCGSSSSEYWQNPICILYSFVWSCMCSPPVSLLQWVQCQHSLFASFASFHRIWSCVCSWIGFRSTARPLCILCILLLYMELRVFLDWVGGNTAARPHPFEF